jgi:hypothetical protein
MPQGKRRPWRDADNTRLIELWDVVASVSLIAIMMQRTPSSVQTQASRLSLPPRAEQRDKHRRRWTDEDDVQLDKLMDELRLADGRIPIQAVADRTGRSVDAVVARLLARHGEESDILSRLVAPPPPAAGARPAAPQRSDSASTSENKNQKNKGKVKTCLKCRKPFWSSGNHNWVCITCKRSDDWDYDL